MRTSLQRLTRGFAVLFVLSCGASRAAGLNVEEVNFKGLKDGSTATGYTGGPSCGNPPCLSITIEGDTYVPGPPGGPGCSGSGCDAPDPRVHVELLDCNDKVVQDETKTVPRPSCSGLPPGSGAAGDYAVTFAFGVCGRVPEKVRVTLIGALAVEETDGTCTRSWFESLSAVSNINLPPLNGTLTKAELDCLACSPKEQRSKGRLVWYKAERSLYTLPVTDTSGKGSGETVNGKFRVPSAGQLVIEVKGAGDAVDVWGGPDGAGWQTGSTRKGTAIGAERTLFWSAAPAIETGYEFNVRGYRGTASDFDVLFHWYRWDDGSCCIQHEVEGLGVQVLPLPCELDGQEPVTPQMRRAAAGTDGHFEVRIPCCPTCDDGRACAPGNLSRWFVAWPDDEGRIREGHAKGWRIDSGMNTLWSPGADRLSYEFVVP